MLEKSSMAHLVWERVEKLAINWEFSNLVEYYLVLLFDPKP